MKYKILLLTVFLSVILSFNNLSAHCDSMEGPVVKASQKALETGNINYVLIWVRSEDEPEIITMFNKVNEVRTLSPDVKELADMYFFETVVRVHRIGEGVGYTGLKPAGYQPEEGIEAADIAIENGSVDEILSHLDKAKHSDVIKYFNEVQQKKNFDVNNLNAGREYVEAYVHFIHYIESLFEGKETINSHHEHKH